MSKQVAAGAGITVGATLLMGGVAHAADTFTVGTTSDTTPGGGCLTPTNTTCELREALSGANTESGATIAFRSGLSGTITLGSALPVIAQPMTITGPGAGQLTIDGVDTFRGLEIYTSSGDDVAISGVHITHGHASIYGGGIRSNAADLTLTGVVVDASNTTGAGQGGGISAGDHTGTGGSLTIANSTISGNSAEIGGGISVRENSGVPTTIRSSTISGNQAVGGLGGGAHFDHIEPATVENSTIYGNSAPGGIGGGLYHYGRLSTPGLVVAGSTITHNTAGIRGGGVASGGDTSHHEPSFRGAIVAGNSAPSGPDISTVLGPMEAAFSLIQNPAGANLSQTGPDITGQDPQLGPLASNGGSTQTQKPSPSSPTIDKGAAFGLTTDQRGSSRPFDAPSVSNAFDGSDMGSVELQASDFSQATGATRKCRKHKKKHKRSAESAKKKCKKKRKKK